MKDNNTFPLEINIENHSCCFNVRKHGATDGRYTVEYSNGTESYHFQLVRTPIGQWVAGGGEIPDWLHEHANELGKTILSLK